MTIFWELLFYFLTKGTPRLKSDVAILKQMNFGNLNFYVNVHTLSCSDSARGLLVIFIDLGKYPLERRPFTFPL